MILLIILIVYLVGALFAYELTLLVEDFRFEKISNKNKIRAMFGSWYSCYVLNKILNRLI